ncbi:hypothetical protein MRX96_005969 [Rhipicephalus microplus]
MIVDSQWLRGHGESNGMRTEPIILLLQVFSVLSTDSVATSRCKVHHIERPPWHRATSRLEHARGTTPIRTVTSQRSGYTRTVDNQWLSGHGENVLMITETIILLLQVFLCSAPTSSPPAAVRCIALKDRRGIGLLLD